MYFLNSSPIPHEQCRASAPRAGNGRRDGRYGKLLRGTLRVSWRHLALDSRRPGKRGPAVQHRQFHLNTGGNAEGNGYAVYLRDLPYEAFADSMGVAQGTSADMYAHDGKANTHEMYDGSGCSSPAAVAVFSIWRYGQSAYIPSVAQMRLLYAAKPYINDIIRQCGGNPLPDEAEEVWYWTSTKVAGQETSKAWLYSIGSGAVQETPKLRLHKVRPIITLNE